MRDLLTSLAVLAALTAPLVGAGFLVHADDPPSSWERCGLTWTEALADPEGRDC